MKKKTMLWLGLIGVGAVYLLNLTAGFIEFVPDNTPLFGNIDEGIAGALIYFAVDKLLKKR